MKIDKIKEDAFYAKPFKFQLFFLKQADIFTQPVFYKDYILKDKEDQD